MQPHRPFQLQQGTRAPARDAQVYPYPSVLEIEPRGFREIFKRRVVVELQSVDATSPATKDSLGAIDFFAQRAGGFPPLPQYGACPVEFASVDQCGRSGPDRRKLRPIIAQAHEVGTQADQFIGGGIQAGRDFLLGDVLFAKLFEHRAERRFGNALGIGNDRDVECVDC